MTERETNLRSVLFLVIGILLLLSLVICIYIVNDERDLVKTEADVISVTKDVDGTGKNDVTLSYEVDGVAYRYNFYYKDDVNVDDKITIYYHEKSVTTIKTFKTSKLIFLCPVLGLVLCLLGLFELFKKDSDDGEEEFKTSVINVVDNTQQLKIVTTDSPVKEYEKTPEEKMETQVKTIKKDITPSKEEDVASKEKENPVQNAAKPVPAESPAPQQTVKETAPVAMEEHKMVSAPVFSKEEKSQTVDPELPAVKTESKTVPAKGVVSSSVATPKTLVKELEEKNSMATVENAILKKVQDTSSTDKSAKVQIDENEIKDVIRDVLKEVLQEVKEEKEPPKKVEQRRVLPNYYYISGTSLIYEEPGKEAKEVELKTIKNVVRTVNSEGNVVKLVVSNEEIKCILTNMKNIDLEQVANLLHNKMRTIDENFKEEIEHKEY